MEFNRSLVTRTASGDEAAVANENGQVMRRVRVEPVAWVVRGTRVELISPPGLLSPAQLAAIRRAMMR